MNIVVHTPSVHLFLFATQQLVYHDTQFECDAWNIYSHIQRRPFCKTEI